MAKEDRSFEVLWEKKYWNTVIDQMIPSKRIFIKKYLNFDEFVIYFDYSADEDKYDIKITPDISVSNKAMKRMTDYERKLEKQMLKAEKGEADMEEVEQIQEESELFTQELNNSSEFLQDYLSDQNIFFKVLVEHDLWPRDAKIEGKDPYEFFGIVDKTKKSGFVYFIRNEDIYKIGITDNLMRRMKELEADEIINTIKCANYESLEKDLHKEFKEYRIPQTEYFRLTPELVEKVNQKMIAEAIL